MWTGWDILTTRDLLGFWLRWCGLFWFALIWFGFSWLGSILDGHILLGLVWYGWDSCSCIHKLDGTYKQTLVLHWSGDKAWLSGQVWPKPGQIIIWSGQIWSGRPYNLSGLAGYGQARPKKLSGQVICGLVRPNNYLVWSDLVSA